MFSLMRIEHFALNVAEPVDMAAWYCEHFNMRVVRHLPEPAQTHFLADETGDTVLEIYRNPPDQVPDYANMDPLIVHLAFASESPDKDIERLKAAGASLVTEIRPDEGSHLVMMRDPWGLAIQLCRRSKQLVGGSL